MKEITDERISEIYQESEMCREIEKVFSTDSWLEFENDFISMVRKVLKEVDGE